MPCKELMHNSNILKGQGLGHLNPECCQHFSLRQDKHQAEDADRLTAELAML